jgi:hypothetical protein
MEPDAQHDDMMRVLDEVEKTTMPLPTPMPGFEHIEWDGRMFGGLL